MIELKNFTDLNQEEITLIWQWRNDDHVAFFMINKNIKWQEHINFIEKLKQDQTKKYFLVFQNDQIIGVIDFVNITKSSCEFGLYAKPDLKGVGQILMDQIKKYAFENLKVQRLKACVFKDNEKALKLYQKNGFVIIREDENFYYVILNISDSKAFIR